MSMFAKFLREFKKLAVEWAFKKVLQFVYKIVCM